MAQPPSSPAPGLLPSTSNGTANVRILWLGYHKVLTQTELPRLRHLGFEVFCPPYLSDVYDQSANPLYDPNQPTTLPAEAVEKLQAFDFFHLEGDYPPEIAEIINACFEFVIVTINSLWLKRLLRAYRGSVIYRLYGQHFTLADQLVDRDMWDLLVARPNFTIVPFAPESITYEHRWLQHLCSQFVPYQMPDDAVAMSGTWDIGRNDGTIATSIPNIQNSYFGTAYDEFSRQYSQRFFRIYGPQRAAPVDPRIVGQLERPAYLQRLRGSAGFLYAYTDHVCYLPPIEFMQIGGPVVFAPGSLLARFYRTRDAPGCASSSIDAESKLSWLLKGDRAFIGDVIAAQDAVRRRYDPSVVNPVFDKIFTDLLRPPLPDRHLFDRTGNQISDRSTAIAEAPAVVFFLHLPGLFARRGPRVFAAGTQGWMARSMIDAVLRLTSFNVVVTCASSDRDLLVDLFEQEMKSGRLVLELVERGRRVSERSAEIHRLALVTDLNRRTDIRSVVVPHPFAFPESLLLRAPLFLYSPGLPAEGLLAEGRAEDGGSLRSASPPADEPDRIRTALVKKAAGVFVTSEQARRQLAAQFLDDCGDVANRMVVLPPLAALAEPGLDIDVAEDRAVASRLGARPYLFCPAANHRHSHLDFLVEVFASLRRSVPDLALVLTCNLDENRAVADAVSRHDLAQDVVVLKRICEDTKAWLYGRAAALCLTSSSDGRCPPQILEALHYETPIVATRLRAIDEALGASARGLALCEPLDLSAFVERLSHVIAHPIETRQQQQAARGHMAELARADSFATAFCNALLEG